MLSLDNIGKGLEVSFFYFRGEFLQKRFLSGNLNETLDLNYRTYPQSLTVCEIVGFLYLSNFWAEFLLHFIVFDKCTVLAAVTLYSFRFYSFVLDLDQGNFLWLKIGNAIL